MEYTRSCTSTTLQSGSIHFVALDFHNAVRNTRSFIAVHPGTTYEREYNETQIIRQLRHKYSGVSLQSKATEEVLDFRSGLRFLRIAILDYIIAYSLKAFFKTLHRSQKK